MDLKAKAYLWLIIWLPVMALALFVPAGTGVWFAGWVYLVLLAVSSIALTMWLLSYNPGLLEERIGFKPTQKTWDKMIRGVKRRFSCLARPDPAGPVRFN